MTPKEETHFKLLRAIEHNPDISQRDLARLLGVSCGKAHYLVAALVEKGLLKMAHFGLNGDKLAKVAYLLTPEGVKNRVALTRDYLARKEAEYHALQAEIAALRQDPAVLPAARPSKRQHPHPATS
jgi:EPS-associated MarR family transcriptional regulator